MLTCVRCPNDVKTKVIITKDFRENAFRTNAASLNVTLPTLLDQMLILPMPLGNMLLEQMLL
jgi:hypothetical protein